MKFAYCIDVRNAPFDKTGTDRSVLVTGNVVTDYQKTGIIASGSVAVTMKSNTVYSSTCRRVYSTPCVTGSIGIPAFA